MFKIIIDFFKYDKELVNKVNQIIESNKECKIIYIRNIMKNNLINKFAPFKAYEGTTEVELVSSLKIVNDNIFDKYAGISVHKYLLKLKINVAKKLLQDGGQVSVVAENLGFASQSYFSKAFKRETGFTPSDFAKNSQT